ncbi:MAG: LamG-like jellyroll fold domain-containing protein, partial [Chloroflexota bacterium]
MKYRRYPRIVFFLIFSTLFFTTLNYLSASGSQTAEERVFAAWYKAQDIGEYTYDARIEQVSRPLPMLINVGLSSHTERILVQGQVDLDDKLLDLKMWNSGGSVLNESQAVEIQIRDGETKGRVGDSDWEEVDDISSLYIPGRDALGILYAAVNIQDAGPETRANITFTRYTFDIDGPAYAHYMRTQLEQELARKGALPHGMEIELADQFVNMSGYGEIWIDEVGLPLRQTMFMQFPPAETEQVEATTTIDFSSWGTDPFANLTRFQRQVVRIDKGAIVDGTAVTGFVFLQIALIGFLFTRFNWQKIYRTSSIILVLSMLFSPLLQATATHASAQNLSQIMGHQRTLEAEQEEAQQIQEEMMMPTFDTAVSPQQQNPFQDETPEFENFPTILPNSLPLAIPATLTATIPDTDGDGLNDTLEAEAGTDINNPDSDGDGLNDMQEVILLETDPKNVDTDSDTLSDYIEYVEIGTDPLYFDTDNDLLSDKAEVQGFLDSTNTRYYTNPLEADTNMDGQTDGVECLNLVDVKTDDLGYAIGFGRTLSPNESCQDTDNDGTPDVLDLDNDNDGVTDRNDIDPYTALGGGEKPACGGLNPGLPETAGCVEGFINQTFNLKINSFEDNKPLLVDFQLRPEESSHLWYNLHVLDWPDNDQQGQIRTGSEQTFGNSGAQANGDLRLIPMLSVEIPPSGYGTLPLSGTIPTDPSAPLSSWLNTDKLDQFNITVRQLDERGTLEALVPINMVTDQVSQSPVAFSAQMYYQPTVENWQADHQVKLIWLVQVINEDGDAQIVHTYNDDWYLTGLAVTENHGVKAGLIYEDPIFAQTVDGYADDTYYEGSLWTLSTALNHTFLSGRRDVDIEALKTRLDKNSNGVIPADDPQLFGIGKETLFVDLFEYEHVGELGYLPGEIATVLDTTFTPLAVQDKFTAPLIMIVREESTKTVGLTGSGILTQDGVDLRFAADVVIQAGMQWSPYQFDPDTNEWETYLPQSYWQDHLEPRIQAEFDQSLPEILNHYETHKEAIDRGASRVAASYFFANKLGATATVQQGDKPLISASSLSDSEILQFNLYNDLKKEMGVSKAVVQSISTVVKQAGVSLAPSLKTAGNSTTIKAVKELFLEHSAVDNALVKAGGNSGPNNLLKQFAAQGRTAIKAGAVAILAIVALSLAIGFITKDAAIAIDVGQTTALVAFQMVSVVASVKQLATAAGGFKALASSASGFVNAAKTIGSNISKFAKITAAIGIAIAVGVAVGVFIAQVASGSIDLGTQAGREAIATLVATIIVAVIMGVIGLIPGVGVLIVAIIGVIDAVIGLICRAAGIDQDPKYSLLCGGISGLLTKFVKAIIYSYQTVVKTSHEDRVLTGIPGTHLQNPEEGYAAGNTFIITMPITRSLFKNSPNSLGSIVSAASGFFTDENAKSSIFDYDLISGDSERHNSLVGRQRWIPATGEADFTFVDTIDYVVVMQPGVNFDFDIHFSEAYRVDSIECVTFVCDWDDERKTNNSYIEGFEYDILPETFAEFVTMANQGGGDYSFGWWYTTPPTGLTLPTFRDADGDGLVSTAHGGSDDGDNAPDRDSDGLDDLIESQMGSNPIMQDTDSDGLSDYLELLYGTKPTQADTDNDGLRDGEEIAGWEFVYAFDAADQPLSTWVRSDPLNPDTDGDNISDKLEEVYGFNPQVNSSPDVLEIETAVYEYIEVPAGADCATVTLDTITVQDAVRNDLEYAEHIDAELEIRMDGLRVWYQDGILDGDSFPINKSVDFCDREVPIEVIELDQGDWNNDVVVNIDVSPQNGSETRQFSSAPQGSQLTLSWTMSDYTDATVLVRKASDGYVAPGQELAYIGEVENVLRNRLAFGLLDVEFSAGLPNDTLYEQPFVLPARQVTGVRGQVTVDPAISASQIVSFTNQVGALIDPDTEPAPETVTDPITPTLWLQFDNGTEYDNVGTGAGLTIDTTTANSRDPMTGETGRLNEAIKFEGRDHVYVSGNDVQLTNGRFTIATWLMRDNANSNGTIMGWAPDGNPGDYPRLWVRDGHIGVSFEGSGGSCTHETTTDFLGSGQWEHVAVTFDQGQIRFYVNGALVDSHPDCSGNLPNATHNEFFIGRGHHHATITFHSIHVTDEADGAGDAELELYGRYGGGANGGSYRLGDWGSLEDGDNITINQAHAIAGDDRYNFIICERDNDDSGCNTGDGDTSNLDTDYYNYETGYHSRGYSGDGTGTIDFTVSEGATYLNGVTLDEFQIYTEDISSDQIRDLIMSVDANLLMPLNEQPASVKFYDHSGNKQHGICLGSGCPTTGILGREGQAARFDGVNDYVVLTEDTPEDFRLLDDNITVAMWVKPETATGALFTVGDDSLDAATLGLTPNQWHHVAWVLEEVGGSYELHTYRDTALVNTTPLAAHPFAAGEAVYFGGTDSGNSFNGLIDQLKIYPAALDTPSLTVVMTDGGNGRLPLNDPPESVTFENLTGADGTCTNCPDAGVDGQIYGALNFDGIDDEVNIPNSGQLNGDSFSVAMWVKPVPGVGASTMIRAMSTGAPAHFQLDMNGPDDRVGFNVCGTNTLSQKELNANMWSHIVLTYKQDENITLYLNGTEDSQVPAGGHCSSTADITLGIRSSMNYAGMMDELVLFGNELSDRDVRELYN